MGSDTKSSGKDKGNDVELIETFNTLLKGRDVNAIQKVIENLNMLADAKRREEYTAVYEEFEARVTALGFATLQDFIVAIEAQGIIKPSRAARRPVAIRYIDPNNTEHTWTGRGKQPKWLQAYLNEGHKIEEFEIKTPEQD